MISRKHLHAKWHCFLSTQITAMVKDIVIVLFWPKLKNNICIRYWEYIVLSHIWTLKELILFQPIDMEELIKFMKWAERAEATLLQQCQISLKSLTLWQLTGSLDNYIQLISLCHNSSHLLELQWDFSVVDLYYVWSMEWATTTF